MRRRHLMTAALLSLPAARVRAQETAAPVVLELFTSQGCSSCPPADALLGELTRKPGIIGLAWHVDYWNRLGWNDPFAQPAWTGRQRDYARALNEEVYTPAMVVNGAAMVVGSDRAEVQRAIAKAARPSVSVTLRRGQTGLEAMIGPVPSPMKGLLVSYDPEQTTQIGAGENHGRRLIEYRVARSAVAVDVLQGRLALPPVPENRGAVLLIRDAVGRVVGASDLPPLRPS